MEVYVPKRDATVRMPGVDEEPVGHGVNKPLENSCKGNVNA